MRTYPAVVHYALEPLAVELREVPVPEIGPDDVLLAVGAVSVCGSDVHQAHNTHSWPVNIPVVLGHEFGGTVARTGSALRGFREGDRVVSETAADICGTCLSCRGGRYNLCPARKGFGYGLDGAMAHWVRVPARCLHAIPASLPFDVACLAEPHAVAYNAMCVNSTIRPGEVVVVLGPGPIGLLCARMAALSGADPLIVAGLTADCPRLDVARALGATRTVDVQMEDLEAVVRDSSADGADLVCDATGASQPLDLALRLLRPAGQLIKVGSPEPFAVNMNPLINATCISRARSATTTRCGAGDPPARSPFTMPESIVGLQAPLARVESRVRRHAPPQVIRSMLLPGWGSQLGGERARASELARWGLSIDKRSRTTPSHGVRPSHGIHGNTDYAVGRCRWPLAVGRWQLAKASSQLPAASGHRTSHGIQATEYTEYTEYTDQPHRCAGRRLD